MTFIVILIGLLIERFFDWGHLRHWQWYQIYQHAILTRLKDKPPYFLLAAILLPLALLVALIEFTLNGWLYGFLHLIFAIIIFIYCLGPKDLWAEAFANLHAMDVNEENVKSKRNKKYDPTLSQHFLGHMFVEANRRVFAVIFWFALLGPIGAVLYRASTLTALDFSRRESAFAHAANAVQAVLEWMPARLLTILFALGGHFAQVFACWRTHALQGIESNDILLIECGTAALGWDDKHPPVQNLGKLVISLLDRSFIIMLIVVGLLVAIF